MCVIIAHAWRGRIGGPGGAPGPRYPGKRGSGLDVPVAHGPQRVILVDNTLEERPLRRHSSARHRGRSASGVRVSSLAQVLKKCMLYRHSPPEAQPRLETVGGWRRTCVRRKRRWPSFIIWRWAGPALDGWIRCRWRTSPASTVPPPSPSSVTTTTTQPAGHAAKPREGPSAAKEGAPRRPPRRPAKKAGKEGRRRPPEKRPPRRRAGNRPANRPGKARREARTAGKTAAKRRPGKRRGKKERAKRAAGALAAG